MDIAKELFYSQQSLMTLFSAANKLQMQGDKYLGDLTIRQMLAIPAIIHAPEGKATINHIARTLGTTKQSAKHIVDAMEKKGYLFVAASQKDKRAVSITITQQGTEAFKCCSERTDAFLADIFGDFTGEELQTLWTLLLKLYRFDGCGQEGFQAHSDGGDQEDFQAHVDHSGRETESILKHHQTFLERRTKHHA